MNRLQLLAGALALLPLVAPAARADGPVTGSLTLTASSPTIASGADEGFTANYQVTNLGSATAHVEIDVCTPGADPFLGSGGVTAPLGTCTDGYGNSGTRLSTSPIVATGDSQGTTGIFSIYAEPAGAITPPGTQWTVPARLIDDTTGTVLATASITVTVTAAPAPAITKAFYSVTTADKPGGGPAGYDVTWSVALQDDLRNQGAYYEPGATTVSDPVPSGAVYVGGQYVVAAEQSYIIDNDGPDFGAQGFNSAPSITAPGTAPSPVTEVDLSLSNVFSWSGTFMEPSFLVTYWYPGSTTLASNTATALFPDGTSASATASVYLGEAVGTVSKTHLCAEAAPGQFYTGYYGVTAFDPDQNSNLWCAWDPQAPVQYQVDISAAQPAGAPQAGSPMPMLNPVVTDVMPSKLVLTSLDGIYASIDNYFTTDLSSSWTISVSTDAACSATSGTFTPITTPASMASLAAVRCVRYAYPGFTSEVVIHYTAVLSTAEAETLDAQVGLYEIVDNDAYLSADDLPSTYHAVLGSTFWNSQQPNLSISAGNGTIGGAVLAQGNAPFVYPGEAQNYLGYTDLTFGGTLPLELDLTGPAYSNGPSTLVDDSGAVINPTCTYTAQDRTQRPVVPATWQCTVPGHIPSFTTNPFTDPSCGPPDYCSSVAYHAPWNEFFFLLPLTVVAGEQGQVVTSTASIWSTPGPLAPGGIAPLGNSAANPVDTTFNVYINGTSQLTVRKSTASISVQTGGNITYTIDYSNTGTTTTTTTYVYDLFGMNPTTGDPLSTDFADQGCNASGTPTLVSVSHTQGTPASVLEYTTTPQPTLATATWTTWNTTPPTDLSAVTGVRFLLNSAFTSNPGDYSPSDQPGEEQLTLQAPPDVGQKLCNMAAIGADGFTVAGALAVGGAIPITPVCPQGPGQCDPVSVPGPNATVSVGPSCGNATVALDGSGSTNAISYDWSENGVTFSTIAAPTVSLAPGVHTLTLAVTNSYGVTASNSVVITVADTTAPVISCPASVVAPVNSACVPSYSVTATATDNCSAVSGQPTVVCTNPSLTPGQTSGNATCTATDAAGNTASCTVPVTVSEANCAPSVQINGPYTVSVTSTCGPGTVQLNASESNAASYAWSENGTVFSTDANPQATLALGVHTISVSVTNAIGQVATDSTTVTVYDGNSPTITCAASVSVPVDGTCSATYNVQPTSASDSCDPAISGDALTTSCDATGSIPAGQSKTVYCYATNSGGNTSSCSTVVTATGGSASTLTVSPLTGTQGAPGALCNSSPLTAQFTLSSSCANLSSQYPIFTATYLDANNQVQTLTVSYPTIDTDSATNITGSVTITGTSAITADTTVTLTATNYYDNSAMGTTTVDANLQACSCTPALSLSSTWGYQDTNGNFCDTSDLYLYFTLNSCGQTNNYNDTFTVTYDTGSGPIPLSSSDVYGYFYDDTDGLVDVTIPDGLTGPVTYTVSLIDPSGATIATFTTSQPSAVCGNALCVPDGMVLFEDLWPDNGDLDFNDQTVAYNYEFLQDTNNHTYEMNATFNVLAEGATIHNGLYLHFPGIPSSANVTLTEVDSNGNSSTILPVSGENELVVPIVADTRSLYPNNPTGFINTDPNIPAAQGVAIAVQIAINDPSVNIDPSTAPFDVFIARTGDYGHQIHLSQFPGTNLATPSLFNSGNDNSSPALGAYYVNQNNLAFALNVPVYTEWPQETVSIGNVYPDVINFALYGDANNDQYVQWYYNEDYDQAYQGDSQGNYPYPLSTSLSPLYGVEGACYSPPFGSGPSSGGDDLVLHGKPVHHK